MDNDDYPQSIQNITTISEEVLGIMSHYMNFTISIGISDLHNSISELACAYTEACTSLSNRFFTDCRISFYLPEETNNFITGTANIKAHFEELVKYIQASDLNRARHKITEILNQKTGINPVQKARASGTVIYSILSSLLTNYNHYQTNSLDYSIEVYTRISQSKSINEICDIFFDMLNSITKSIDLYQVKNNVLIEKVIRYIENNYSSDITLSTIADYIHLNSSYLSRLFKKETGKNITEVITSFRIQKAKELLLKSNIKTYEIGCMVGISDSAHFSNLFKKYTGLSPKEFKMQNDI